MTYETIIDNMKKSLETLGFKKFMKLNEEESAILGFGEKEYLEVMREWVDQNPLATFHDVKKPVREIMDGLEKCTCQVIKCLEGHLVIVHGHTNGQVVIKTDAGLKFLSPESEEFANLIPEEATNLFVVSCYPGAKPREWEVQGRTFHNIGDEMSPITIGYDEQTKVFKVGYVSPAHKEFIEHDLLVAAALETA